MHWRFAQPGSFGALIVPVPVFAKICALKFHSLTSCTTAVVVVVVAAAFVVAFVVMRGAVPCQ